jgi:hypothetical protein
LQFARAPFNGKPHHERQPAQVRFVVLLLVLLRLLLGWCA